MMSNIQRNDANRLLHLDLLRLLAICFVIFNHTGDRGYMLFANSLDSAAYYLYMMASALCKTAVPIFFMISGALLLPRQESLGRLFSKRILRMVVVLVLISVPYYVWLHRDQGLRLSSFLAYIYSSSASTSLWYLYSYVALLLMMPFLRIMVRNMEEKEFLYLMAGYLIMVGVVPCAGYCLWGENKTPHPSFNPVLFQTQNLFYALAGYYVEHRLDDRKYGKKLITLGLVLSVMALVLTCALTNGLMEAGVRDTEKLEQFFNCFICIPTITLYCVMKQIGGKLRSAETRNMVSTLGGAFFGVYLIEKFSRALTGSVYVVLEPVVGSFPAALVWVLAVLVVSMCIVLFVKRIPGIRKIVNWLI